ncbi:ATP-dependent helicase HrpB [Tateyamaria sp.]|uniref:ATP-dependent helicase HrpB n=1 Tax=Tateyamaria sp. TaxID=1929288 RepID=UPI003B223628
MTAHIPLPIDAILPDLLDRLRHAGRAVLQAPPGAGKTTRVPLALLDAGMIQGKILMLEPRRLAARAAADRMAATLGEKTGQTVGYRIRGDSTVGPSTRIEVVTEGILTRMLQDAPDLPGVGAVIFDEFHERSLNADLGLALCLEVAEALRDDLMLLAMSATLDAGPVAEVMQAPILTSEGRSFEVEPRWLPKPRPKEQRFETAMADLILHAVNEAEGSLLAFLPGEGEIRRTATLLEGKVGGVPVYPLFGAMDFKAQRAAVAPGGERKIVLATSIAETSLTIPDIRIVVDGGRARRARFDPSSGMSRLITERVTRAEATQRAGRAGRVASGVAYKLWTRGEDGALAAFPPPEIEAGDLSAFALELAMWGGTEDSLRFVTPPHPGRLAEARSVLQMLGALDGEGRITAHGKALARQPLHPRLGHMLVTAGDQAATLAALLAERDPMRDQGTDLTLRLRAIADPKAFEGRSHRGTIQRIRDEARRLRRGRKGAKLSSGAMAALAYPDRIGMRRTGDAPRYVLSGGKGAVMPSGDALAGQRLIVATDLDGDPREAKIRQAAVLSQEELEALFGAQVGWKDVCQWSRREGRVLTRSQQTFGALVLEDRAWKDAPENAVAQAMLDGVRQLGLRPTPAALRLMKRAALMDDGFADLSETTLMETLEEWLLPHLTGVRTTADWKAFDILPALQSLLGWDRMQQLDRAVPGHFTTPLGRKIPIDYADDVPGIAVRLQEMFGVTRHPVVGRKPLQITLLSPARRPVQVTSDLPRFWETSYEDVRKDMRGQYPKHPWPDDPTQADPTLRTKPRR